MKRKHLGIHMNPDLHFKMQYIAIHKNRSLSKQIIHALNAFVESYEAQHGQIELSPEVLADMEDSEKPKKL